MKRTVQLLFTMLLILALAAGCGQQGASSDKEKKDETKTQSDDQSKEEMTAEEIITKSSKKMKDWPGMAYNMNGKQKIHAKKGTEEQNMTQDLDMDAKIKMDPMQMHMNGKMKTQGQQVPVETYYKDKTMFQKIPNMGWIAITGMDLDALRKNSQAQDPAEQMKNFADMLKDLSSKDEEQDQYISKKEKDSMYVVTLDLDEDAVGKVEDVAGKMMKQNMGDQMQKLFGDAMDHMKYKSMKITYYIDKDTFEQKKMNQQMSLEINKNGAEATIDSDMDMDIQGKFKDDINIPSNVRMRQRK